MKVESGAVTSTLMSTASDQAGWLRRNTVTLLAGCIFLLALAVRVYGIGFGLPYADQPDEPSVADKALKMLQTGDFNPHYFVYPHLYYYMQAALYGGRILWLKLSGHTVNLAQVSPTDFYLWGRLLTALLGAGTALLVYATGRWLYSTVVGLSAALFIAFNSINIINSQFITTDVPTGFFTALAFLLIARLLPSKDEGYVKSRPDPQTPSLKPQYYLALGAAMGLAIGTKYNAAIIVLPFLIAHAYAVGWQPARIFGVRLWLALAAMAVTFVLTSPFIVLDMQAALKDINSVFVHYQSGHPGFESNQPWLAYLSDMWHGDTLVTLLAGGGLLLALLRHRPADVVLLSFPVAYFVVMSRYIVVFPRNLLPLLPFVALLAALPLGWLWDTLRQRDWRISRWQVRPATLGAVLALIALISVALPAVAAFANDAKNSKPDTRALASAWLDANAPPGAKLWLEPFSLILPQNRYVITGGDGVIGHDLAWYSQQHFDFLVVSEGYYGKFLADPQQYQAEADGYANWFKAAAPNLAIEFPRNSERPGPGLRIYRTGYQRPSAASIKPQHPLNVQLTEAGGGAITLLGYDVGKGNAGSPLPLTLYWRCDTPLKADYTVFIHLLDANGGKPTQRDTQPRSGAYPTTKWQAGEVVVDEEDVPLPATIPSATYRIEVGMYLASGPRLNTADGSGALQLGEVVVKLYKWGALMCAPTEYILLLSRGYCKSCSGIAFISPFCVPT